MVDGYKVLHLCTNADANVDAIVLLMGLWLLLMVCGQCSTNGGSGFIDFTDGQSSVIVCRWVSFNFFFSSIEQSGVLHFFFFNLLLIRIKESHKRKREAQGKG